MSTYYFFNLIMRSDYAALRTVKLESSYIDNVQCAMMFVNGQ